MDEAIFKRQLGKKLAALREKRGLTLEETAASSGLSTQRLEGYEGGGELPALGELVNLARVFEVSLNQFFLSESPMARVEVVRASERWKVRPQTDAAAALNYSYEALSYRLGDKAMSPFHIEIPPSAGRKVEALSHEGEEFHFVLSGEVEMEIDQQRHRLAGGDAIYFDARLPHSIRALGSRPARLLACLVNVHRPAAAESPMLRAH